MKSSSKSQAMLPEEQMTLADMPEQPAPAPALPVSTAPIDVLWLARHDRYLAETARLLHQAEQLLVFPDGTRPQIVRGRSQMALDKLRDAARSLQLALVPFDPPHSAARQPE